MSFSPQTQEKKPNGVPSPSLPDETPENEADKHDTELLDVFAKAPEELDSEDEMVEDQDDNENEDENREGLIQAIKDHERMALNQKVCLKTCLRINLVLFLIQTSKQG